MRPRNTDKAGDAVYAYLLLYLDLYPPPSKCCPALWSYLEDDFEGQESARELSSRVFVLPRALVWENRMTAHAAYSCGYFVRYPYDVRRDS